MAHVRAQLRRMKRSEWFRVTRTDGRIMVCGDSCIGDFDSDTGQGVFSVRGNCVINLDRRGGGRRFKFPQRFVEACLDALESGDEIELEGNRPRKTIWQWRE